MASYTAPTLHATGDDLAVTDYNAVANNTTWLAQKPYFSYYNSVAASVANNTVTQVALGGSTASGYGFSVSSNNVVVPLSGTYWISGAVWLNGSTGFSDTYIYHNGTVAYATRVPASSSYSGPATSGLIVASVGDTIALWTLQTSGGSANMSVAPSETYLSGFFVGLQ